MNGRSAEADRVTEQVVTVMLREHRPPEREADGPSGTAERLTVSVKPFSPVTVIVVVPVAVAATGPNGFGEALMVKSTTWTFTVAVWSENPADDPVTVAT